MEFFTFDYKTAKGNHPKVENLSIFTASKGSDRYNIIFKLIHSSLRSKWVYYQKIRSLKVQSIKSQVHIIR